jgi:hypothetical protein
MHLTLIKNTDESKIVPYKLARVIYAETGGVSLSAVEALVSMIRNLCMQSKRELIDIAIDANIFECLDKNSARHECLLVDANSREFQMCLRVVSRMLNGDLPDRVSGATRFHRDEIMPDWATSCGYVAEIDGLIFYI